MLTVIMLKIIMVFNLLLNWNVFVVSLFKFVEIIKFWIIFCWIVKILWICHKITFWWIKGTNVQIIKKNRVGKILQKKLKINKSYRFLRTLFLNETNNSCCQGCVFLHKGVRSEQDWLTQLYSFTIKVFKHKEKNVALERL